MSGFGSYSRSCGACPRCDCEYCKFRGTAALEEVYSCVQDIWAEDLPCPYLERRVYLDEVRKGLKG